MKAEHRKVLETNVLADRVGRAIQGIKQRPKKRTVLWFVLIAVVLVAGLIWWRSGQMGKGDNSQRWLVLELGDLDRFRNEKEKSNAARAAHFQVAWSKLWDGGLKRIALSPVEALNTLDEVELTYEVLATRSKDDPTYLPEALYALAAIEEARAIRHRKHLDTALERYKTVADKHGGSAFGQAALQRIEIFEDKEKREDMAKFYQDLQEKWKVPEQARLPRFGKDFGKDLDLDVPK